MKGGANPSIICPYCGAGCRMKLLVREGKATDIIYEEEHPVAGGALCAKGNSVLDLIYHKERLLHPMVKNGSLWDKVDWQKAITHVAKSLEDIRDRWGPKAVGFLASAKATNEENYLLQKFARLFGSPHIDHCARLCHAPSIVGLTKALGSGAMTNPIEDLEHSRCILIIGSNLAESHPVVSRRIYKAKDKGAFVVAVDPRKTITTAMADLHLQLNPGTDSFLLLGLANMILRYGLADYTFIEKRTEGFKALEEQMKNFNIGQVERITGLSYGDIFTAARIYALSEASSIVYCMGITQHVKGTDNVGLCANLALLCGQIGKKGAGIFPLRGQNNVQGASDMGAVADILPGYVLLSDARSRKRIASLWGREDLVEEPGLSVVEMMDAIEEGKLRALFIMGENPVISDPSSDQTIRALKKLDLLVVQDLFLTETADLAHVVFPAASVAEKNGSYTNTERRVQWVDKVLEPPGEAKPDLWIVGALGKQLKLWNSFPSPESVLEEINRVVPSYRGITVRRLKSDLRGLFWPCYNENHPGTPILYTESFNTSTERGRFVVVDAKSHEQNAHNRASIFHIITGRVGCHYNSGSLSRRINTLNRYEPHIKVTMNPNDAAKLSFRDGQEVILRSPNGTVRAPITMDNSVPSGSIFVPFHFPGINRITLKVLDRDSKIPAYKDTIGQVENIGSE